MFFFLFYAVIIYCHWDWMCPLTVSVRNPRRKWIHGYRIIQAQGRTNLPHWILDSTEMKYLERKPKSIPEHKNILSVNHQTKSSRQEK